MQIDVLEEVVEAVKEFHIDVYFDGGVRHGKDIFVAMALGAKAVFIGRPVVWGLSIAVYVLQFYFNEIKLVDY